MPAIELWIDPKTGYACGSCCQWRSKSEGKCPNRGEARMINDKTGAKKGMCPRHQLLAKARGWRLFTIEDLRGGL